jgi:putative DNA methylase
VAKKLIEVALPLEAINNAAAYEKMPGIGAHPRGLHLWWARRPLAAARAVIWSSLVDDPSEHPEQFPTEEEQAKERQRLFAILEKLVKWENSNNPEMLDAAKAEILRSTGNNPPSLLDPFAGGGAIPLEAQRLGLEAHAHDLNPVAVMINKAMIEIPPKFAGQAPVKPDARARLDAADGWTGAKGLAEDMRYYGEWMKQQAFKKIGHLYPKVEVPAAQGGGEATAIAWIWARTVKCPNPACGCEMPLASSFVLSKKKGKEAWVKPIPAGDHVEFEVQQGKCPKEYVSFKVGRSAVFKCPCCGEITTDAYVKKNGQQHNIGSQLMAVVAEGQHGRIYLSPDEEQKLAANVSKPENHPDGSMPTNPRWFSPPAFGMTEYSDLFTNRQLTALTTFSELVSEAQKQAEADAVAAGLPNDHIALSEGGTGARAYGEAVGVYLAFAVDRLADFSTSVSRWSPTNEKPMNCFSKQAIPMTWDYPEANPMGKSVGSFSGIISYLADCINKLPYSDKRGYVKQFDAQSDCGLRNIMVSTDPPYYDNIGYADLSDFFYVWMRQTLKHTYPALFRTMLVPKAEELVATPYRFDGSVEKARDFFEDGMLHTCQQIYQYAREDVPVTIYYAYKQNDTDTEESETRTVSTGWETMLSALIQAGFAITGTWPMRTEQSYRAISMGTNALASSIVLVCRKRPEDAPMVTRRNFIAELKRELRPALQKLQRSNIAPVDLAQSAIGPGMGVYSKYSKVLESDGTPMTVRSALQIINQELDVYFNEQDGELDQNSRFCVDLYMQNAFNDMRFGEADTLARAKNTSVAALAAKGVLFAQKGSVHLLTREELPEKVDEREETIWLLCQQLTHAMATGGIEACAQIVVNMLGSNAERAKDLAYRLYTVAERKGWAQEAYAYNALVIAWPEIQSRAAELQAYKPEQITLF